MKHTWLILAGLGLVATLVGCQSAIVPMEPVLQYEKLGDQWVLISPAPEAAAPVEASTEPTSYTKIEPVNIAGQATTTAPATTAPTLAEVPTTAPARTAAVAPLQREFKTVDPNQTTRSANVNYDNSWNQAMTELMHLGFRMDRLDYRFGVMTTLPLHSATLPEVFKGDSATFGGTMENTIHSQRRIVRLTYKPNASAGYDISVQAVVERYRTASDQMGLSKTWAKDHWEVMGRDPSLEAKILDRVLRP
ncbi:MAG: hypothetical protein WCJ97_00985 [Phycisphaerae bacterium]